LQGEPGALATGVFARRRFLQSLTLLARPYNDPMPRVDEQFLLSLLQACAARAPEPLYPVRFSSEQNIDRDALDQAFDELRRRGLVKLTEWIKDLGQGRALTEAGTKALATKNLAPAPAEAIETRPGALDRTHAYERGEIVRRAILDSSRPYVSWTLLSINVSVFFYGALYAWHKDFGLMDYLAGAADDLHRTGSALRGLGGLCRPDVFPTHGRPQFERLITACFLHLGILHLAMNMFFLATLGGFVETMWGKTRFLTIYFVAGIVSSCVVLLLDPGERSGVVYVTVGASGPLYGVFAALIVWLAMNYQHLPEQAIQDCTRMIGVNLMLMVGVNFVGGVSWQGHLGGALGGLMTALLLHQQRFHPAFGVRLLALVAVPLVPIGFFLATLWHAGWLG